MSETPVMKDIMLKASEVGARLFRNNNGMLKDERGNRVRYGLGPGTSDLIGWTRGGRFLAVEVKNPGGRTLKARLELQERFIAVVNENGGLAFIAHSVEEFLEKYNARNQTGL